MQIIIGVKAAQAAISTRVDKDAECGWFMEMGTGIDTFGAYCGSDDKPWPYGRMDLDGLPEHEVKDTLYWLVAKGIPFSVV